MYKDLKIVDLEKLENIKYEKPKNITTSLPKWYYNIRDVKVSNLSNFDLIRLVRQQMFLKYILYECIKRLYSNPIMGDCYDGELIELLSKILNNVFFKKNNKLKRQMWDFILFVEKENRISAFEFLENEEVDEINQNLFTLKKMLS